MFRLRVFSIGCADSLTDDHLAAMLADSPLLQSLKVTAAPVVTGAFLGALPVQCYSGLREIRFDVCEAFDDDGASHLARFCGLETMNVEFCESVTTLPLTRMPPLRSCGAFFLSANRLITSLDLSPLRNLTYVGPSLLYQNSGLTSLDLSGLRNLTLIDRSFLCGCSSLTTLDLSALSNVESVADYFLESCGGLTSLDVSGLKNVVAIGDFFLHACDRLTVLDLAPLAVVQSVGKEFLVDVHLKRLRLSDALLRLDSVHAEHKLMHAAGLK